LTPFAFDFPRLICRRPWTALVGTRIYHTLGAQHMRRERPTKGPREAMSALPPKVDIGTRSRNVRFVPKADILIRFTRLGI
jgi:hypothetical protein